MGVVGLFTGHVYNVQGFDLTCRRAGGKVYNPSRGAWYGVKVPRGAEDVLHRHK